VRIEVETEANSSNDGVPVRFRMGTDWVPVSEVLDRWLARDHRYFKVSVGGDRYIVRHDIPNGVWDLTFFAARQSASGSANGFG
jgi:hypothetical protein